ncbi:MAG: NAD-dependent epimerase/dehydratase family protein, partial [Thermoplasmata archaeon]
MSEFYRAKTVMVTGAAGFLGSHLVERLYASGARVVALDSVPAPDPGRATGPSPGRVRLEQTDVTDAVALERLIREERPEVLFHLA